MNKFVSSLHSSGQQYVVIIDPGIKVDSSGYSPYTDGINMNIFIKDHEGKVLTGKVWPGITAFPDFFHPNANQYWEDQISKFHQLLPVDGLWIDMNEISNFCNGECSSSIRTDPLSPPYSINNQGNKAPLNTKAISVDAVHYGNVLEYNAHNLFGLTEAIATNKALENVRKTRSFVISRSTFPGSGSHTGHWTGDNHASWDDLYQSIPGMLNFQMFGVPLVGSDICGFIGNTNEELCGRWMQLGAFYPFSRNHNSIGNTPQEPYRWSSVADISRAVLSIRYTIIPYYYTQFYKAHIMMDPLTHSSPTATVVKPLFFEFSDDPKTYDIDKQFLIGNGIMVTPVLTQGATTVDAYFPKGVWYDFYTSASETDQGRITKTLSAPLDHIPIHFRGGHIIPLQYSGLTTAASRANPFGLKVALDGMGQAYGDLFYDDGESLNITNYIFVSYTANNNSLAAKVAGPGIDGLDMSTLDMVTVMGVSTQPKEATINGNYASLSYDSSTKCMTLSSLDADMTKDFVIKWM
jgi:alpha-glucosidase (family GH31 glycosyl hydrolase)